MNKRRDIELISAPNTTLGSVGRNVIAVIGIDRYYHWRSLSNAVSDATGAVTLFQRLGFEQVTAPLLDDHATGKAIQSLVTDDLATLGPDDSLVLFYAGHGGTRKHRLGDQVIKTGYLIPVDASDSPDKVATWLDMEGWLRTVSLLPAKHILVILDACHSGIALDPVIKWRDTGSWQDVPLSTLKARRSRRIITSALDDQVALDSGPVYGHSLFTGCLIEGLSHGIRRGGGRVTTGSELGLYVQRRVETYPHSRQTPDFGTFSFDDRGEMVIPLMIEDDQSEPASAEPTATPTPGPLAATSPIPISPPPPTPLPAPNNVASIAPTPEPAQAASTKPLSPPIPRPRRRKRPTPAPNISSEGGRKGRRWLVIGTAGAMLAIGLVGYSIFGREPSRVDLSVDLGAVVPTPINSPDASFSSASREPSRVDPPVDLDATLSAPINSPDTSSSSVSPTVPVGAASAQVIVEIVVEPGHARLAVDGHPVTLVGGHATLALSPGDHVATGTLGSRKTRKPFAVTSGHLATVWLRVPVSDPQVVPPKSLPRDPDFAR